MSTGFSGSICNCIQKAPGLLWLMQQSYCHTHENGMERRSKSMICMFINALKDSHPLRLRSKISSMSFGSCTVTGCKLPGNKGLLCSATANTCSQEACRYEGLQHNNSSFGCNSRIHFKAVLWSSHGHAACLTVSLLRHRGYQSSCSRITLCSLDTLTGHTAGKSTRRLHHMLKPS